MRGVREYVSSGVWRSARMSAHIYSSILALKKERASFLKMGDERYQENFIGVYIEFAQVELYLLYEVGPE